MTLDRGFDMPRSGVTSDDSWYLTSFVILTFCCLSFALLSSTFKNKIQINSQWRIPCVFSCLSSGLRRSLYFVVPAVRESIRYDLARFFVSDRSLYQIHTMAFQPHTGIDRKG